MLGPSALTYRRVTLSCYTGEMMIIIIGILAAVGSALLALALGADRRKPTARRSFILATVLVLVALVLAIAGVFTSCGGSGP